MDFPKQLSLKSITLSTQDQTHGLAQDFGNSTTNPMESLQPCAKPLIWNVDGTFHWLIVLAMKP